MFHILIENILLTIFIITLMLASIVGQLMIGGIYQRLINEADNLAATKNKNLKLCKLKFQNCYEINGNVPNISVFVDKFISRLTIFRISLNGMRRLAAQFMMLGVFGCGVGASVGIIGGETMFRLLPYYILGIVGLYIYFSVAALVDVPGRRETLKINLMDYLENHMLSRLRVNLSGEESKNSIVKEPRKEAVKNIESSDNIIQIPVNEADKPFNTPDSRTVTIQFSEDEIEALLQELIV